MAAAIPKFWDLKNGNLHDMGTDCEFGSPRFWENVFEKVPWLLLCTKICFSPVANCNLTIVFSGVANYGIFDYGKTEILKANASKGLLQSFYKCW